MTKFKLPIPYNKVKEKIMASKAISIFGSKIDPKGYVKISRVARHLDVSTQTVRNKVAAGEMPKLKEVAGCLRFEVPTITRWLEINAS